MPISCHFQDCKALLVTSLTHVSGAITSVLTFTSAVGLFISWPDGRKAVILTNKRQFEPGFTFVMLSFSYVSSFY